MTTFAQVMAHRSDADIAPFGGEVVNARQDLPVLGVNNITDLNKRDRFGDTLGGEENSAYELSLGVDSSSSVKTVL